MKSPFKSWWQSSLPPGRDTGLPTFIQVAVSSWYFRFTTALGAAGSLKSTFCWWSRKAATGEGHGAGRNLAQRCRWSGNVRAGKAPAPGTGLWARGVLEPPPIALPCAPAQAGPAAGTRHLQRALPGHFAAGDLGSCAWGRLARGLPATARTGRVPRSVMLCLRAKQSSVNVFVALILPVQTKLVG